MEVDPHDSHSASVTSEVAARYRAAGHAVVRACVPTDLLERIDGHLASLEVDRSGLAAPPLDLDPVAASLAAEPVFVELASLVLDEPVRAFGLTYLVKPTGSTLPVLWHQDGHPWAERGIREAVTVWVAVDPATEASGCLWVVPGSHRLGARPLEARSEPPNVFGWASPADLVDEGSAVPVELDRGDVSLHHPALLHRSGPNRTTTRRAALALRYCRAV